MDSSNIGDIFKFNPNDYISPTKWLVKDLIPLNSLTLFLSQSGVGKSFVVEWLATCVRYGIDFLGYRTLKGDVLYIDQDTPTDTLKIRLRKFAGNRLTENQIYLHSNQDYEISDELLNLINNKYNNVNLIVIDCLTRLIGHADINDSKDMAKMSIFKLKILENLSRDISLVIVHHTSDKKIFTLDEIMESQSFGEFTFGSSVINQIADSILLLYSQEKGKKVLKELYLRPIAKRFQIETRPIKLRLIDNYKEMYFRNDGFYHKEDLLEKRIMEALLKGTVNGEIKIFWKPREIYENIGLYSETIVREKLREMISLKKITYVITNHNLHLICTNNANKRKQYKLELDKAYKDAGIKNIKLKNK